MVAWEDGLERLLVLFKACGIHIGHVIGDDIQLAIPIDIGNRNPFGDESLIEDVLFESDVRDLRSNQR